LGAALLRYLGVSSQTAGILAVVFAFVGIFVMFFFSRTTGAMVHCLTYCPIGILADFAGKISPFRLKIKDECSTCRLCTITCRYDALNIEDLERKKPGITCTLCGDCLSACKDSFITYSFFGFQHKIAYPLFIVTIVTFHACFLGLARL
ncbi:MAG: hypothetical protein OEY59_09285, partial [Deltaproteobacteria bacterium]|nr:hypothetical protein [Deltaproteobacteria bacterium]